MPSTLKTLSIKRVCSDVMSADWCERRYPHTPQQAWGRHGKIRYEVSNSILHTRSARVGRVSGIRQMPSRLLTTNWSARSPGCLALND
jgi:uncharacterized membrane protein